MQRPQMKYVTVGALMFAVVIFRTPVAVVKCRMLHGLSRVASPSPGAATYVTALEGSPQISGAFALILFTV